MSRIATSKEVFAILQKLFDIPADARKIVITCAVDSLAMIEVETTVKRASTPVDAFWIESQRYMLQPVGQPTTKPAKVAP